MESYNVVAMALDFVKIRYMININPSFCCTDNLTFIKDFFFRTKYSKYQYGKSTS